MGETAQQRHTMSQTTSSAAAPDPERNRRYIVVSADSHCGPSLATLRPYCPESERRAFDDFTEAVESSLEPENQEEGDREVLDFEVSTEYRERRDERARVAGLDDPDARLADMDRDGVAAEVIFHGGLNGWPVPFSSTGLLAFSDARYDALESVGVRIYNRWLADFVSVQPHRRAGLAHIPIHDIDMCVAEVEWAAQAGLRGVNFPAPQRSLPPYNDRAWERLWAACAANDMVLCTHSGGGDLPLYQGVESRALLFIESNWFARRATWFMVLSGVFNRHPRLKFVATEQYADWPPTALRDMDSAYLCEGNDPLRAQLPNLPSERWRENCFVGASFMSRSEAGLAFDDGLVGNYMWGSDYPHPEGTWPNTVASLRATFAGYPTEGVAAMLGENAIDVYGLDRSKLLQVAAQVGPSVAEVDTPLDSKPEWVGMSFREIGKFA